MVVSRLAATVPGCPDYSRMGQPQYDAHTSSNFGCAINANIAAMVARPEDLIQGQADTGPTDVAVSGKAIDTFRKAPNTGAGALRTESTGGR